ncbi:hypothetical protein [Xenorhabdus littoralis]|nr:hypothetical protein [Xenorhabdus sp. psl]
MGIPITDEFQIVRMPAAMHVYGYDEGDYGGKDEKGRIKQPCDN